MVNEISTIQTTIAAAVEEQTATTQEMSRNVTEVAQGAQQIAENIGGVAASAISTSQGAACTQPAPPTCRGWRARSTDSPPASSTDQDR